MWILISSLFMKPAAHFENKNVSNFEKRYMHSVPIRVMLCASVV